MAIVEKTKIGTGTPLAANFDWIAASPIDSRSVVETYEGLAALVNAGAVYAGMRVYVETDDATTGNSKGNYQYINGEWVNETDELKKLISSETTAAMEFKGGTASLPENPSKGDFYKVTASFTVEDEEVKIGDSIIYNGEQWFVIPSGDDIEDTWRPVTDVANDATLTFAAGDKLGVVVNSNGTVTYKHVAVDAPELLAENEQTRTYITEVETDGFGHITGYKTATESIVDTDTTYTFEGQSADATSVYFQVTSSEEGASSDVIYLNTYSKNEIDTELGKKVDKVEGYSLISDTEIARLAEVDNYDDEEVRGLIGDNTDAIDELSEYIGTIPNVPGEDGNNKYADLDVIGYINKKAQETLAAASGNSTETAASVKSQLDDYIGQNNTRVKAVEDDVAAINDTETGILKQAQDYADGLAGNYDEVGAAAGVKSELETEIAKRVDKETYDADKATFATKTELGNVDTKFAGYVTTEIYNAHTEAQSGVNSSFEGRIAAIEAKFGDGEGNVESQISAAIAGVQSQIDALDNTYATDSEVAGVKSELEGKINLKANSADVEAEFAKYTTTEAQTVIDAEQDRRLGVLETASATHALKSDVEAEFAKYTKTADLPTDLGDFTNNAGYAKTSEVSTELDKKADKTQVATDITNAIAPLATTEALNGVKATAEAAAVATEVEAALELKANKSVVDAMYTNAQIDEFVAGAKSYADGLITEANLDQYTTEQEVKDIVDGVIKTATSKETLDSLVELVEYIDTHSGDAINMATAIGALEGKVEVIEKKPAYEITSGQITNWDNEVGAKALAGTKLDASVFTEYSNAHAGDYTNKQIDDAIDADVKTAIDAEVLRAEGAYDAKGSASSVQTTLESALATAKSELNTAIEAAKTDASNKDAVVLSEAQKGIAAVQSAVDTHVGDTVVHITADERTAWNAAEQNAKDYTDELANGQVATNKQNIEDILELLTWGSF